MKACVPMELDVCSSMPVRKYITAKQGDDGTRFVLVSLTAAGVPIAIPDGTIAIMNCAKPDNTYTETEGSLVEGCFEFELTPQTLAVCGNTSVEIQLISADKKTLTSATFEIRVLPRIISDDLIESTDEYSALVSILSKAETLEKEVNSELAELRGIISEIKETIEEIECKKNKTYIINSNSTDVQYPSAKAVKTYVDTSIGSALEGDY